MIEDVLKTAFAMIDELDNRVRNMEYINSQEFICDLLRTVDYSKDEIDENKRIMYAKYLTACCHIDNARIQQASAKLRNVFVKALLWC